MKQIAKKQVNGKNIVIVDSENANIDEVVDAMIADGWDFDILRASYVSKTGEKKAKDFTQHTDKIVAIQRKYNLDNWAFKASKGSKVIAAQMSNKKHTIAVQQSRGGALKEFCDIKMGYDDMPFDFDDFDEVEDPIGKPYPMQEPIQGSFAHDRMESEQQIFDAIYADDDGIPEITPMEKEARKAALRKEDKMKAAQYKANKHTGLLIMSILVIFSVAGIVFGGFALRDTLAGRKLPVSDPGEAERRFKEARILLIFGILAFILMIVAWVLPQFNIHLPIPFFS